jgi:hypothetical protein
MQAGNGRKKTAKPKGPRGDGSSAGLWARVPMRLKDLSERRYHSLGDKTHVIKVESATTTICTGCSKIEKDRDLVESERSVKS